MPIYSYQCVACAYIFEAFQKITDGALIECPKCGKALLKRGVGGGEEGTFQFQGDGFYVNGDKEKHSCSCGKKTECCRTNKK